jgi:mannose-6-phosphate isomerase-like protein (cupin superfamily)
MLAQHVRHSLRPPSRTVASGLLIGALMAGATSTAPRPALAQAPTSGAALADRIGHNDPGAYRRSRSHGSEGDMACMTLVPRNAIPLLNFVHRCQMTAPLGGVGHHFHNATEEMFVIFDGEAEFTIDGRTSLLEGTVGAPVRMGHSHAIVNPTDRPIEFMNINVASVSGQYDAFDLDDSRVGATKDPRPVFMTMRLDKALLGDRQIVKSYRGGTGTVKHRRALGPTIFLTNWSYVDHLLIPPGASEGLHRHPHLGEVYYVLSGNGVVTVSQETAPIRPGDGVPIRPDEAHSVSNSGTEDLEIMIIGVATEKGRLDTVEVN